MNKNIKRTIALALAVGTVSAVAPATNKTSSNLLTTKVYAATDDEDEDEDEDEEFDDLKILDSNDKEIKIYDDEDRDSDSKLDDDEITSEGTYYIKTSSSKIKFDGSSNVDDDRIKVFKGTSDSTKGKDIDDEISISEDTTITVRVYDEDVSGETVHYDDEDEDYDVDSEYTIEVKYTGNSDGSTENGDSEDADTNADDYDDIYLEKLSVYTGLETKDITLSESKVAYSYEVPNNIKEVIITATPADEDEDEVTIDDTEVSSNYRKKVSLNEGTNKFTIKTENEDDDKREYTLTITRAAQATAATSTTATAQTNTGTTAATAATTVKPNQWIQTNGKWQYNDSFGRAITNNWALSNGKWYYLGADSYMQSNCWILVGGKYYYLYSDGSMAANTTVNGYKVDSNGAWIR